MEKQKGEFAPGDNALKFWGESTRRIHHVFIWESGVFWWGKEDKAWEQSTWSLLVATRGESLGTEYLEDSS